MAANGILHARELARALEAAGVVHDINSIERIVIDISASHPVRVHVQRIGDKRLIGLAEILTGAEVVTSDAQTGRDG